MLYNYLVPQPRSLQQPVLRNLPSLLSSHLLKLNLPELHPHSSWPQYLSSLVSHISNSYINGKKINLQYGTKLYIPNHNGYVQPTNLVCSVISFNFWMNSGVFLIRSCFLMRCPSNRSTNL